MVNWIKWYRILENYKEAPLRRIQIQIDLMKGKLNSLAVELQRVEATTGQSCCDSTVKKSKVLKCTSLRTLTSIKNIFLYIFSLLTEA